ncbi:MAG: hypothetical protein ACLSXO_03860 [Coprococcus sp.]
MGLQKTASNRYREYIAARHRLRIQKYAEQAAQKVMEEKQADGVSILLMNPQNGNTGDGECAG